MQPVLAALPLLLVLSQAEAAPPEPPAPSEPAAEPAPAAPAPAAAAPGPVPRPEPGPDPEPEAPRHALGFTAGLALRRAPAAEDVPPAHGFAFSPQYQHTYARIADTLELGLAARFAYERYSRAVQAQATLAPGQDVPYQSIRGISHYDFVGAASAAIVAGLVRPWVSAGGGLAIGYFSSREEALRPGEARSLRPVVVGGAGVDVDLPSAGPVALSLALEHAWLIGRPTFTTAGGERLRVFGDRFSFRAGIVYRF